MKQMFFLGMWDCKWVVIHKRVIEPTWLDKIPKCFQSTNESEQEEITISIGYLSQKIGYNATIFNSSS
jgi:hypothetical protein